MVAKLVMASAREMGERLRLQVAVSFKVAAAVHSQSAEQNSPDANIYPLFRSHILCRDARVVAQELS